MRKGNNVMTTIKCMPVLAGMLGILYVLFFMAGRAEQNESGVPDALNSMVSGGKCRLTVAANADYIEDKEAFAREVIRMCRENSFRSLRLSTDIGGWPEELEITVYYHREDFGREEPVMRIRYEPVSDSGKISIENDDPGKYILSIE